MAWKQLDSEVQDVLCAEAAGKQTAQGNEGKDKSEDATQKLYCQSGA